MAESADYARSTVVIYDDAHDSVHAKAWTMRAIKKLELNQESESCLQLWVLCTFIQLPSLY